jgi:hypothetical protein
MPSYSFRNRYNKVIRGTVSVRSEDNLFDKIDEQTDPFAFEYCKVTSNTLWFDEDPTWLMFDSKSNQLVAATDANQEIIESLQNKLAESKFDDYTCFVMARRDLAEGDLNGALARIKVDRDKLICLDKKLYDYVNFLLEN